MAYQLSDLVSKVQTRVKDTSLSSATITEFLNDVQNDVFNEYDLRFMEASQDYTLTINVSDITNGSGLPTNFVSAINLTNTTSGYERIIPYMEFREADDFFPDEDDTTRHAANVPLFWYLFAGTIHVFPKPNTAHTLTLRYKKRPTVLAADADVPTVPQEFEELMVIGASFRVYEMNDNYVQASYLKQRFDEMSLKFVQKYARKQMGSPARMRLNGHASGT